MASNDNFFSRIGHRALREIGGLIFISLYFWMVFATVLFLKATTLHSYGIQYVVWGAAALKAVFIAKFMMMGQTMKIGEGYDDAPLMKPISFKVFGFFILLLVLTGLEEAVTALLHHRSLSAMVFESTGPKRGETIAEILVLFLALVPFVTLSVFSRALGEGTLRKMLFEGANSAGLAKRDKAP